MQPFSISSHFPEGTGWKQKNQPSWAGFYNNKVCKRLTALPEDEAAEHR